MAAARAQAYPPDPPAPGAWLEDPRETWARTKGSLRKPYLRLSGRGGEEGRTGGPLWKGVRAHRGISPSRTLRSLLRTQFPGAELNGLGVRPWNLHCRQAPQEALQHQPATEDRRGWGTQSGQLAVPATRGHAPAPTVSTVSRPVHPLLHCFLLPTPVLSADSGAWRGPRGRAPDSGHQSWSAGGTEEPPLPGAAGRLSCP